MLFDFANGRLITAEDLYPGRVVLQIFGDNRNAATLIGSSGQLELPEFVGQAYGLDQDVRDMPNGLQLHRWEVNASTLGFQGILSNEAEIQLRGLTWREEGTTGEHIAELHMMYAHLKFEYIRERRGSFRWELQVRSLYTGPDASFVGHIVPTTVQLGAWAAYLSPLRGLSDEPSGPDKNEVKPQEPTVGPPRYERTEVL